MTPHTAPDVMDKEQCAKYLGVGTTTVERWRDTEGLPYIKIGAIARYRRAAIDAWLAARETTNHPTPTPAGSSDDFGVGEDDVWAWWD